MIPPDLRAELSPLLHELLGFGERASTRLVEQFEGAEPYCSSSSGASALSSKARLSLLAQAWRGCS
jgi:hypothetical protein